MKLTAKKAELLPPDVYHARLENVEESEGSYGMQLKWRFTITQGEHAGASLTAWSNLSSALNSKTMTWAGILRGKPIEAGEEVDFDLLRGAECRLVVKVKTSADRQYNVITDILPAETAKVHAKAAATAQPDPFEEDLFEEV